MTWRRDQLPGKIGLHYLPKTKSDKTTVERFFHTIVSVKNTGKVVDMRKGDDDEDVEHIISKAFQRFRVSFQLIPSCNISTVKSLKSFKMSDMIR